MPESFDPTADDLLELEVVSLQEGLDAEGFISVFRHTVDMLEQIVKNISEYGSAEEVQWQIVHASMASPFTTTLRGNPRSTRAPRSLGQDAVRHAIRGLHALERSSEVPFGFNAKALDDVADLLQGMPRGISGVTLRRVDRRRQVKESAPVTKTIAGNARAAKRILDLERAKQSGEYVDYGTLEGTLRDLLGASNKLVLVDELTGKTTNCTFKGEENDIKARQAWKGRVAVTGDITYDKATRLPISVHVDEIRLFNPNPPQLEDFAGIDITGGMDSADFIRGLRDDD